MENGTIKSFLILEMLIRNRYLIVKSPGDAKFESGILHWVVRGGKVIAAHKTGIKMSIG